MGYMRGFFLRSAFLLILGLFVGVPTSDVRAQTEEACGYFYYEGEEDPYPIVDCVNPFGLRPSNPDLHVFFDDIEIEDGGVYPLLNMGKGFTTTGTNAEAFYSSMSLYKKVGNEYRSFDTDLNIVTFTEPGTYTLVVHEEPEVFQVYNPFRRFLDMLIPTAYAFDGMTTVFTFEVTDVIEKPRGISNILFLPGIQASRLYTKDEDGDEEKLWEPGGDDDVLRLAMTEAGESVEDIYAKEVIDELGEVAVGDNIYKGFLEFLDGLGTNHLKPTIGTFPYDWRYDVFDVVEKGVPNNDGSYMNTVEAIEYLATTSVTGKVTLIAHSNGGLLAKAIMRKLEDEGKTELIDRVIFIAVPHIGTPKGIMALLHGYDQSYALGLASTDEGVRKVIRNMPGVYGLLPSETYFNDLGGPIISFDDSTLTESFRNAYGFTIGNMDEYTRFLNGAEGRTYVDDQVNEASTANSTMLDTALQKHKTELDNWEAPPRVEVFNIVGTGLPTPNSIEYKSFEDVVCAGTTCKKIKKIEPVIHFTNYGDQTVVSKSAKNVESNNIYFSLDQYNATESIIIDFEHADITETDTIQSIVDHILHGSSTNLITHVSDREPSFSNNIDIVTIHSPARIYIQDEDGNITGRRSEGGEWQSEIPGSNYFEAGGVKYLLVPSDVSYNVTIEGEGTGVYTHARKRLQGDTEELQSKFTATVTPLTVATYSSNEGLLSNVSVDMNGDGKVDTTMRLDGTIVPKTATYEDLYSVLQTLSLSKAQKKFLVGLAHQAEKYSESGRRLQRVAERATLLVLRSKISTYQKLGLITKEKKKEVEKIINDLLNKKII
jgi:pimeloyl-ACP methyl ester carboxylesterase